MAITCSFLPSIAEPQIGAMRGRNPDNPNERKKSNGRYKQRLEMNENGISNTLTSVYKDNVVVEPKLKVPQATAQGYAECELGGIFDASYPNSTTRRGRVQDGGKISPALTSEGEPLNRWEGGYRIRKLTPRECFRLMDVRERDIDKIQNYKDPMSGKAISNSQQYKGAGNSICVNPMYLTFKNMFYPPVRIQLTIFDIL